MNAGYISQRIYRDITQKRLKTKISPFVCYTHMNLGSIYKQTVITHSHKAHCELFEFPAKLIE